ncbi:MAG: hypothetical protein ACKVQA_00310 [Burkholderiales bacterium]
MTALPILLMALVQGCLLYALHHSIEHKLWPSYEPGWLLAFYAMALFVPAALEIFSGRLRQRATWVLAAAIAVCGGGLSGYTGWATGAPVAGGLWSQLIFTLYGALFTAWLIALPFAQAWARRATWRVSYADLFEFAWQNALLLAEAALFTGVFSLLLTLWGALFNLIGITVFSRIFRQPAFLYPVLCVAFGYAIYLIESHEKIVITLRRHLLGVFSWLLRWPLSSPRSTGLDTRRRRFGVHPGWDIWRRSMSPWPRWS